MNAHNAPKCFYFAEFWIWCGTRHLHVRAWVSPSRLHRIYYASTN